MNTSAIAYLPVIEERTGLDTSGLAFAVVVWDAGKDENKNLPQLVLCVKFKV